MTAPQPTFSELSVTKDSQSKLFIRKVDGNSQSSCNNQEAIPFDNHKLEYNETVATGTAPDGGEETSRPEDPDCPVFCDICLKSFETSFYLKKHKTRIHREKNFQCSECDISFTMKCLLKAHTDAVHQKKFTCTCCEKNWGDKAQLNRHLKSKGENQCMKEKPFSCQYCDKVFVSIGSVNQHVQYTHKNVEGFLCEICNKAFGKKSNMKRHRQKHAGDVSTSSPENCDPGQIELNKLQSVHTASSIMDDIINTIFNNNMVNESKIHMCDQCNSSFKTLSKLKRHTKMHLIDGNNIQCEKCEEIFFSKAQFYEHRPCKIKCPNCEYETLKYCHLRRHIERYHT